MKKLGGGKQNGKAAENRWKYPGVIVKQSPLNLCCQLKDQEFFISQVENHIDNNGTSSSTTKCNWGKLCQRSKFISVVSRNHLDASNITIQGISQIY